MHPLFAKITIVNIFANYLDIIFPNSTFYSLIRLFFHHLCIYLQFQAFKCPTKDTPAIKVLNIKAI